jgi:hypothetical protein
MIAQVEADRTATGSTTDVLNGGFRHNVIELRSGGFGQGTIRALEAPTVGSQACGEKQITAKTRM